MIDQGRRDRPSREGLFDRERAMKVSDKVIEAGLARVDWDAIREGQADPEEAAVHAIHHALATFEDDLRRQLAADILAPAEAAATNDPGPVPPSRVAAVSDAAVEAAAIAAYIQDLPWLHNAGLWAVIEEDDRKRWRQIATAALDAALPILQGNRDTAA